MLLSSSRGRSSTFGDRYDPSASQTGHSSGKHIAQQNSQPQPGISPAMARARPVITGGAPSNRSLVVEGMLDRGMTNSRDLLYSRQGKNIIFYLWQISGTYLPILYIYVNNCSPAACCICTRCICYCINPSIFCVARRCSQPCSSPFNSGRLLADFNETFVLRIRFEMQKWICQNTQLERIPWSLEIMFHGSFNWVASFSLTSRRRVEVIS